MVLIAKAEVIRKSQRVAVVGAGPGGLMLARLLHLRGVDVHVFERDSSPDARSQGGSLDLHPQTGLRAIRAAGLEEEFATAARPEDQGDRLYDSDGSLLLDEPGEGGERPEIDRALLRSLLLEALPDGVVRWGTAGEVTSLTETSEGALIRIGSDVEAYGIVVGADGGWSRIRPLISDAAPRYEGVAMIELVFDRARHPAVDALVGAGKAFFVGGDRVFIGQRNGRGVIRGYLGRRMSETAAKALGALSADEAFSEMLEAFGSWSPKVMNAIREGSPLGVRTAYALPISHRWRSRRGVTLLGDAAHLMSPFAGEGVNLALADAADLAKALSTDDWADVSRYEASMADRAAIAAQRSAEGLRTVFSPDAPARLLKLYRKRISARRPYALVS